MWRGRLARLALALAVGVLAVVVINSFRDDGSDGSDYSTTSAGSGGSGDGGDGGSSASVASRWDTKLDLLGDRSTDCAVPVSTPCSTLMEDTVLALASLGDDVSSTGTDTDYSDTRTDITRLEGDISDYDTAGCPNAGLVPGAAPPSAACQVDTAQVTAGIFPLRAELDGDEIRAAAQ